MILQIFCACVSDKEPPKTVKSWFFHTKVGAAVGHEHVEFFERPIIKQQINAFACRQFAFGMLRCDPFFTTAKAGGFTTGLKLLQDIHGMSLLLRLGHA